MRNRKLKKKLQEIRPKKITTIYCGLCEEFVDLSKETCKPCQDSLNKLNGEV